MNAQEKSYHYVHTCQSEFQKEWGPKPNKISFDRTPPCICFVDIEKRIIFRFALVRTLFETRSDTCERNVSIFFSGVHLNKLQNLVPSFLCTE